MTAAKTAEKTTTEEWLYAGQRLNAKDKLCDVWVDPAGDERWFTKLPGGLAGGTYHVDVIRGDDDKLTVKGTPRYRAELAERHATDAQIERWRAETAAARQIVEAARVEKTAAGDDELQRALEVIRRHRHRIRAYAKRGAFDSYVLGELGRPPKPDTDDDRS